MIVASVTKIQEQLSRLTQLELAQNELANVNDTLQKLRAVRMRASQLRTSYNLLEPRLSVEARVDMSVRLDSIASLVGTSHSDFAVNRRQVSHLTNVDTGIQLAESTLLQYWSAYVKSQTESIFATLGLVKSLPELQSQLRSLSADQAALSFVDQSLPSADELVEFDQRRARLEDVLQSLRGLSPQVLQFLRKVAANQATLADLDSETLNWLTDADRGKAFRIRFAE